MKIIACILADFDRSPPGLPARLDAELCGTPVLRRTVQRVLRCATISSVHVLVNARHRDRAAALLEGLDVTIETHNAGDTSWRELVCSARKWSLDAWRGGIAGMTVFDETLNPWVLEAVARKEEAAAVVDVPPSAALIDPTLLDAVVQHHLDNHGDIRLAFTQAPPGLSAMVYGRELLDNLTQAGQPIGRVLAYHPSEPQRDMVHQKSFYSAGGTVMYAEGRCLADTSTATARMESLLREHDEAALTAEVISQWLTARHVAPASSVPDEVEVELTTEDMLPETRLRPRGAQIARRGPLDMAIFKRLVEELARRDDARLVLGGFGEPLLHPQWPEMVSFARACGIFGLAIRTSGLPLDDAVATTLSEARVDVVNVLIDAHSANTYRKLQGADRYDELRARIESISRAHQSTGRPHPLLVPEMTKTHATMDELEAFYDGWIRQTGTAVIRGPSHHARQWEDLGVMQMAPPGRFPCRRLFSRAMVLADGRVPVCDQDFTGKHVLGSLRDGTLSDIWTGPAMEDVRGAHRQGLLESMPLCPACDEWHRP